MFLRALTGLTVFLLLCSRMGNAGSSSSKVFGGSLENHMLSSDNDSAAGEKLGATGKFATAPKD